MRPNAGEDLALLDPTVHVWRISLLQPAGIVKHLEGLLSDEEIERANRFYFARDRRSFIVARGALRSILARYLHTAPEEIRFSTGVYGKPYLENSRIRFNLSHSGGLALVAVSAERELGVDVEQIRPMQDSLDIAKRFFSTGEVTKFAAVAGTSTADLAFFTCWTRKEAFIKAIGEGLSHPLDAFEVTFLPEEPVELRMQSDKRDWQLASLATPHGYCAALVVEAKSGSASGQISSLEWVPSRT